MVIHKRTRLIPIHRKIIRLAKIEKSIEERLKKQAKRYNRDFGETWDGRYPMRSDFLIRATGC